MIQSMKPLLELHEIECHYRGQVVVQELSLHVNKGDLFCLLGPSGCGKTTVLRAIAGFEPIHRGEIHLKGQVISRPGYAIAPEKRHIGMVFQNYALFPHLHVEDNIGFGLRKLSAQQRQQQVNSMLETVG